MGESTLSIPVEFWDESASRWNSHRYFDTVNHQHFSHYRDEKSCDIMLVECRNGCWYREDSWGDTEELALADVFYPFNKNAYPTFFNTYDQVNNRAAEIISQVTGVSVEYLLEE